MIPIVEQDAPSLVSLLQETALFLWKEWPRDMELAGFKAGGFTLRGTCPHCGKEAAFPTVTNTHDIGTPGYQGAKQIAAASCIACNKYILGIIKQEIYSSATKWVYEVHYPLGKPNDDVNVAIPEGARLDFQEALRCRWVNAFNATIEMCGRALESSCLELGADKELVLSKMIDWVHGQGKITNALKDVAHKIKLRRNQAAHPASDRTLTAKDADAVIEFTREYFQHVYIMPAKMAEFDKAE